MNPIRARWNPPDSDYGYSVLLLEVRHDNLAALICLQVTVPNVPWPDLVGFDSEHRTLAAGTTFWVARESVLVDVRERVAV